MTARTHVPPLEKDSFTYVGVRVAVRLIAVDYRHNPAHYRPHAPSGILSLASRLRMCFPSMFGPLVFVAKAVEQGYSLAEVRCMNVAYSPRALHKRLIR